MESDGSPDAVPEYPGYFGGCPTCHRDNGYLNVGSVHFLVCHEHRCCWRVGANLFSSWRRENEEIWARNYEKLRTFKEVEPYRAEPFRYAPYSVASAARTTIPVGTERNELRPENEDDPDDVIPF